MKHFISALLSIGLILILLSCDDNNPDTMTIAPVSDITYTAGAGTILFKWKNPDIKDISYIEISYTDSHEIKRKVLVNGNLEEFLIEGFGDNKLYEFTFIVYGSGHQSSIPVKVSLTAQPYEPSLNLFNSKVKIARRTGGILVSWDNIYNGEYYINVTYYDVNNNEHAKEIVVTDPGAGEEFVSIEGMVAALLHISTSDIYGNKTPEWIYDYKVFEDGNLDRSIWVITCSSDERVGDNAPVTNVLDGNVNTFWHTEWYSGTNKGFPHYFIVDMRRKMRIEKIRLQHRQNKVMAKDVEFQGSNQQNGVWNTFGKFSMSESVLTMQEYVLPNPVEYRYVKALFTTPSSKDANFAALAEFEITGSDIEE